MGANEAMSEPVGGTPVQVRAVPGREPSVVAQLARLAILTGGRLLVYGGLAVLLFLSGALAGVWSYAEDQRLPDLVEANPLLRSYTSALAQRRQAGRQQAEWRQRVDERLRLLAVDQLRLQRTVDELGGRVTEVREVAVYASNYLWCGTLDLHGRRSASCEELVERGELPADFD